MNETLGQAGPTARIVPGRDPAGASILSLLCKRTYRIAGGALARAPEQVPLCDDLVLHPDNEDLILFDSDLYAYKPLTDVIVVGHAYAPSAGTSFNAGVLVGAHAKQLVVLGDRRAALSSAGRVVFSPPDPVEKVPLRHDQAYGGHDADAERRLGDAAADVKAALRQGLRASDYVYPRNFYGKGYLIEPTREALEALALPNLEDPADRLTPDRLVVGGVLAWPKMPLPWTLGVIDPGFFPRIGYAGVVPWLELPDGPIAEVARGFAPASMMSNGSQSPDEKMDLRFNNGASLGLQLAGLRGDETVVLHNLHPRHAKRTFDLPGERPRLSLPARGGGLERLDSALHSVVVEPDEDRVTMVWRGASVARRLFLPAEIEKMPLLVEW